MKQYNWKKCLKPKDLVVGKFYIFNETSDIISVSLYLGRHNSDYYFYNIMYLNSVNKDGTLTLVSDAQIKHIPVMIKEVLNRSISMNNIVTTSVINGKLLDIINFDFPNFNVWYLKNRMTHTTLPDLVDTKRPGYAKISEIKAGRFFWNSYNIYYVEEFDAKYKDDTVYYEARTYSCQRLIIKPYVSLDDFIQDFKAISTRRDERLPSSIRVLDEAADRNFARDIYQKLCMLNYQG